MDELWQLCEIPLINRVKCSYCAAINTAEIINDTCQKSAIVLLYVVRFFRPVNARAVALEI